MNHPSKQRIQAPSMWRGYRAQRDMAIDLVELEMGRDDHPVDLIEQVANANEWSFDRSGDDEIAISIAGHWTDYHVSFSWVDNVEALHLACAFDLNVPENRLTEIVRLLAQVNEQLLVGHFDVWAQESAIMFRQSHLLCGGAEPTAEQVQVLLTTALEACETYFQAFQFVIWSGVSAKVALESARFETVGTA